MKSQGKERNYHFDNIKALLIFLVVLGHVLKNFGTTDGADLLYKIIFSFHMPAFLFVSGYFAKCNPKRVLSKLFPLYVVFQLARFVLDVILGYIADGGAYHPDPFQFFTPRWTLWYLFALIVYQLLLPVFDTKNRNHRIAFLILAAALGLVIGMNANTRNFMAMSRVFTFLPFFLLGYYGKDLDLSLVSGKKKFPFLSRLVTACLGVLLVAVFTAHREAIGAKIFFGTESYHGSFTWYVRLLTWLIALIWIWILIVWVPGRKIALIETIGANTLPVYLLHSLAIQILLVTPLPALLCGNLAGILVLSAAMTVLLSWNGFERALRKIAIPMNTEIKNPAGL